MDYTSSRGLKPLRSWWSGLSAEAKAAIIGAIVASILGPLMASIFTSGGRVRLWFYKSALRRLKRAGESLDRELQKGWPNIPMEKDPLAWPLEQLAERAGVWKWRARAAMRWREDKKEYGDV